MISKHSMRSTARLTKEAARAGLELNPRKCKALNTVHAINRESIVVNGECFAITFSPPVVLEKVNDVL